MIPTFLSTSLSDLLYLRTQIVTEMLKTSLLVSSWSVFILHNCYMCIVAFKRYFVQSWFMARLVLLFRVHVLKSLCFFMDTIRHLKSDINDLSIWSGLAHSITTWINAYCFFFVVISRATVSVVVFIKLAKTKVLYFGVPFFVFITH